MPEISVIVPVYNEEENLPALYDRLSQVMRSIDLSYELIFINDGSSDASLEVIRCMHKEHEEVQYINFSRNFGHQVALSAGLDHCRGEAAVIIDADLQDPPEVIGDMVAKWREGFQVVGGKREKREGESWIKKATAKVFYRIMKKITSVDIPLDTGDFRLIDRSVIEVLKKMPEPNKFIRGQIAWAGFRQTSVYYKRDPRAYGETGYTYRKMIRFALDGITAFSSAPLKFVSAFGLIVSFIAFLLILYALFSKFGMERAVPGWTSLMIAVLFIGGVQLVAIGIIGEYLSRVNDSVRRRPLYVIEDKSI